MKWPKLATFFAVTLTCAQFSTSQAMAEKAVYMLPGRIAIRIGAHTSFARFKQELAARHATCRTGGDAVRTIDKPLEIGAGTRTMIADILSCQPGLDVPADSPARRGAITPALWRAIAPDLPPPSVRDRIDALTLSFEATDFSDPPVWNFCQDSPGPIGERPAAILAGGACYNATDPCSMLTWGPRGATAGQGAEIQWILWKLYKQNPEFLASAFGNEFANAERFTRLKRPEATSCDGSSALEHFMCAVWGDPARRQAWESGLLTLGRLDVVRRIYQDLYAAQEFDGYKMAEYYALWRRAGVAVSEVDFAFFFDRATHIGSPPAADSAEFTRFGACLASENPAPSRNAAARRCLSLAHPHAHQPVDRLGRDVSYYRAAFPNEELSERERRTWDRHIPLDAVENFGLSDAREIEEAAILAQPLAPDDRPPEVLTTLTASERACPQRIRNPLRTIPR